MPNRPCSDCGGTERFSRSLKCTLCTRRENSKKARESMANHVFCVDKPVRTKNEEFKEREAEIMHGVKYD